MRTRLAPLVLPSLALVMLAGGCYRDGRWYWSQQQADRGYNYESSNNYNSNRNYDANRNMSSSTNRGSTSGSMNSGVSAGGASSSGMSGGSSSSMSMNDDMWAHSRMTGMNESDLPSNVRTTMQRHAGNGQLSQVGRTTWNGQTYYAAQATMNAQPYRVVTDMNGNLVMLKRVNMMGSGMGSGMSGQNSDTSGSRGGMGSGANDLGSNDRDTGGNNTSNTNPQDRPGVPR